LRCFSESIKAALEAAAFFAGKIKKHVSLGVFSALLDEPPGTFRLK